VDRADPTRPSRAMAKAEEAARATRMETVGKLRPTIRTRFWLSCTNSTSKLIVKAVARKTNHPWSPTSNLSCPAFAT
jgi:hypothetical protein